MFQLPDLVTILWENPPPSVPCISSTFLLAILIPKISETVGGFDLELWMLRTADTSLHFCASVQSAHCTLAQSRARGSIASEQSSREFVPTLQPSPPVIGHTHRGNFWPFFLFCSCSFDSCHVWSRSYGLDLCMGILAQASNLNIWP